MCPCCGVQGRCERLPMSAKPASSHQYFKPYMKFWTFLSHVIYSTVKQLIRNLSLVFSSCFSFSLSFSGYERWDKGSFWKNNLSCDILEWWPRRQWNTGSLWNRRVITQPRGSEVTQLCCTAYAITDVPPRMDAALQPSALLAALFNTQVKKIKDARCLVCWGTRLCAPLGWLALTPLLN